MSHINRYASDLLRIGSMFSPGKLGNALSVFESYHRSKITGKLASPRFPISLSIEPTTSCNLRCPECPSGLRSFTRPTGMLNPDLFKKVIDEIHRDLLYLTFYFQGEPFLHPEFLDMVKYASSKKIYTATSTNAHFINEKTADEIVRSGLQRLIISIDGTDQETYENYRIGGSLEKVLEGTRAIVAARKKLKSSSPYLVFQFLVVKQNEHQVNDIKILARKSGVDRVVFKTAQVYDYEHGNALIPSIDKYSRYRENADGTFSVKNKLLNHCWKLWHSCVITWDGKVLPCCFDKDASFEMGNVKENSFHEIWKNEKYRSFRSSLMQSRKEISICRNCTEGTKVWA